jgi:hypothetical protein
MKPGSVVKIGLCLSLVPILTLAPAGVARSAGQTCSQWASEQTGFDPNRPPPAQVEPNRQVAGSGARVRGAAGGAAIGAIAGDAGKGAAAGAVAGGVTQRSRNRRAARAQNDANNQQYGQAQSAYNQALQSCINNRSHAGQ